MATSLRKVSQNLHLTMKRAQIATIVSPYLPDSEALNERNESAHAYPIGQGHGKKPLAEVEFDYRSKSSFTPLPWEDICPPGRYTVIAHNGPLRTRIQGHLDELEEFKARVRRAQFLVSGWLVGLCHLMLLVVWDALESRAHRLVNLYERDIRARILWIPCIAWIKQAIRMAVAWFLPTLLKIRDSALEANSKIRSDMEVNGWPTSKAKRM
ncbi:hypothetical protein BGY98DRAFT_967252 [Russula aff. rugulosa BPL654]|nr:hypothetical protein BGY98DRAFT_967252 [Russula aff. rugulosa BPL654]